MPFWLKLLVLYIICNLVHLLRIAALRKYQLPYNLIIMSGTGSGGAPAAAGSAAGSSAEGWVQAFVGIAAVAAQSVGDGREPTYGPHANMSWAAQGYKQDWPAFTAASPAALAANSAATAKAAVAKRVSNNKVPRAAPAPAPIQQRRWDQKAQQSPKASAAVPPAETYV